MSRSKAPLNLLKVSKRADIVEDQNLTFAADLGLDGTLVSRNNFPLPNVGPKLAAVSRDLHEGRGFAVIRGLDPTKYSVEDLTVMHLGIQTHVANRCGRQDRKGNMLGMFLELFFVLTCADMKIVHIVADGSSKSKAAHHRHSTAPIVSPQGFSCLRL